MTGVTPNINARKERLNLIGNLDNRFLPGKPRGHKPKVKRWSHQDELDALKGRMVALLFEDEGEAEVTLIEADQFAIKVSAIDDDGQQSTLIYFKHTIAGFRAV